MSSASRPSKNPSASAGQPSNVTPIRFATSTAPRWEEPRGVSLWSRFAAVIAAVGVLAALTVAMLVPEVEAGVGAYRADPVRIDLAPLAQRSVVVASDGKTILAALHGGENRKVVSLDDIPLTVVSSVLAVEDRDFFEHGGVDLKSTVRAMFADVGAGDVREGGSTITQQLVKNTLLDSKRNFNRKIREAVLSVRVENQLSKRQILERYLNTVYLGNGAYGVEAAAEIYFGKKVSQIDLTEAALLAGLIKNPTGYDPFRHADAARARRSVVVERLLAVHAIDDTTARQVDGAPLPTSPQAVLPTPDDYFVNEVVRRLLDDPALGKTRQARSDALFTGGLTITTTLDPDAQEKAERAIREQLPDTGGKFTAALVSLDPKSGAVRALVGGPGFERSKYNIATQGIGRQVGSAFKPFVLAAAIENGISPESTIRGSTPCTFPNPGGFPDPYTAENFEGERAATVSVREATWKSINCAYLRLGQIVGLPKVVDVARRLGITAELDPNLSLPLGTSEVRPLDMAAAYATFADDGVSHEPYFVEQVRDRDGKVLYQHAPRGERAVAPDVARTVTDVLRGVIATGTGTAAQLPDRRPAAGKTGTTADFGDAWFVGYTTHLATAVWMGSPVGNAVKMVDVGGVRRVAGGTYPARIWQAFMGAAHDGVPIEDFPPPPELGPATSLRLPGEAQPKRRTSDTAPPLFPVEPTRRGGSPKPGKRRG